MKAKELLVLIQANPEAEVIIENRFDTEAGGWMVQRVAVKRGEVDGDALLIVHEEPFVAELSDAPF